MMNEVRLKQVIQYTLMVASQEDEYYEKDLGPIHFIKYVYLADMEYARYNNGMTFTGIDWQFYHFGPWSNAVNNAIEPALQEIHAQKKEIQSSYSDDDYIRWALQDIDNRRQSKLSSELGLTITSALKNYVHKFTNKTSALLHFVYATLPMLNAAPGEILDFSTVVKEKIVQQQNVQPAYIPYMERLSNMQRKTLHAKMAEIRDAFQKRIREQKSHYSPKQKYDTVFAEGIQWLDSLAGEEFPDEKKTIEIDDSVWKSEARRGS